LSRLNYTVRVGIVDRRVSTETVTVVNNDLRLFFLFGKAFCSLFSLRRMVVLEVGDAATKI
jgi:hypothetical protein